MSPDPLPLPSLPPRPADGHKGTFGTVGVIGGQAVEPRVMLGGPALAALAALRTGAGLAILAVPAPLVTSVLAIAPSATAVPLPVDDDGRVDPCRAAEAIDRHLAPMSSVLVVGPGFGADHAQQQVVIRLVARDDLPLVLDADALNAIAGVRDVHLDLRAPAILTPHPGEYRRLAGALGIDADPTDPQSRIGAAEQLAQRLGCIVVLKGRRTVVTDGMRTSVNETGSVALATAGTGDVLAGMIGGIVAQYHRRPPYPVDADPSGAGLDLLDCARLAVHLHGLAGDLWQSRHGDAGLLATDLVDLIPEAMRSQRSP